jgi:long-chain fatty acid transport protein
LLASPAAASSVLGYPEQGSEAIARGGAWVARASDPIAISRNPAGLAGQPMRLSIGEDIPFAQRCFTRVKAANDTTDDGFAPGASYPRVCDDAGTLPVGYIAMTVPLTPSFAIAAGVVTPTGIPKSSWPTFVDGRPAPQRYMLIESTALMAIPTIGAAYAVTDAFRIGASFGWGLAWVRTSAAGVGLRQDGMKPEENDTKVTIVAKDLFVPRATVGAHATLGPFVELGGVLTWSAPIQARGDAQTAAGAFSSRAATGDESKVAHGDTSARDCGQPGGSACGDGGNARIDIPIPLEASIGVRAKVPRASSTTRDPMESEVADLELDVTWANNSAIDRIGLRFPGNADGNGTIPVVGTAGVLPPDADTARHFKDVVGFRLGGDLVVVPGVLTLRAGGFFEPHAAVPGQTGLETLAGTRVGIAAGATARIHDTHGGAFDVSIGLLHVFVSDVGETNPAGDGVHAITGSRCDDQAPHTGDTCPDGGRAYRTKWPISLGTFSSALNVIHVGAAYRF